MSRHILIRRNEKIISALWQEQRILEWNVFDTAQSSLVRNIYIGRIRNVVPNINGAFVDLGNHVQGFLPLADTAHLICPSRPAAKGQLKAGDEVVVQVTKDAAKTKDATLTGNLSFNGRYAVLLHGEKGLHVSGKIHNQAWSKAAQDAVWDHLTRLQPKYPFGLILRTSAATLPAEALEPLLTEITQLAARYTELMEKAPYRSCYTSLYETYPPYLTRLRDMGGLTEEVITDDEGLYQELVSFASTQLPELSQKIRLYQDTKFPLTALYSMKKWLELSLSECVWLPSGGYLLIQPTEALTVIDVNSGKFSKKTSAEETYLQLNEEAAREIAAQLRLRNLSGIIVVDFIDMKRKEAKDRLLQTLRRHCRLDPIKTTVVDMTKLNLVEITRQRTTKPLHELLKKDSLDG